MRCPACGNENREGARFCDECGAPLTAPAPVGGDDPHHVAARRDSAATANIPPGTPAEIGGRYEVAGFLGRGGRKTVYLARDREGGGREIAIALFETAGIGETAAARARREAQAMERLGQHPRIVSVVASGEHDGAPFLVSEYMPGGNLGAILAGSEGGRLASEQAIEIATDICRALEHAHGHGIVHRDLKPANVWIDDDGRARLGDFGLAATERRSREAGEGTLIGTVAYLPPEQALGRPVDARADLYSLGALLYEMVTGQPPFTGDDAIAVISRHVSSEPVPPRRHLKTIPAGLDRLVVRLLAKSPDERPASAAAARAELEQIAADPEAAIEAAEAEPGPEGAVAGGALVGREPELEQIRAAVEEARAGSGGILLFVGEPGIGKTRAAEELSTYARIRGMRVLWGRCHEGERAPAFWPWTEAIRDFVRDSDPVGLRWQLGPRGPDLARIVPDVAELLGVDVQAAEEEEPDRFRLFDSVAGFLIDASRSRPLVLVLDDLHWADASSLELLRYLAGQLADSGLLLVGAYRDVELGHQHSPSAVLAGLTAAAHARTIHLDGLDEEGVGAMIEASTGIVVPRTLVRSVWERTEGNPFFVGEIVRMLAAERRLSAATTELPVVIPHGAREAVTMRLRALGPQARQVLRIAAVAGREFEPAAVEVASGEAPDLVRAALSEALDARLISEDATARRDWLSFVHAIVRETLYAEIPPEERAAIHRRLGEAIESLHASDVDRFLDDLARHHIAGASGGDPGKAIEYACRAGERSLTSLAFEDAAAHYGRALELARASKGVDGERTLELTLSRGRALQLAGRPLEAREEFEEVARLARERDDVEALSAAALGISRGAVVGVVDEALLALLDEALARCGAGDSVARVELLAAKAQAEVWRDPQGAAQEAGAEALAIARRLGNDHALAVALAIQQGLTTARPEAPRRRLENAIELIEVAERAGDGELLVRGHAFRLHSLLELGEVQAADSDALPAYRRLAEQLRQPQHLWPLPLLRAMRATMEGRFEQAEDFAAAARREGERAQEPLAGQLHALQIAVIRELQGRLEEALPAVREMARNFPAIPAWRMTLASFLAELGNREEARPEFERFARDGFSGVPRDLQWLPSMIRLADTAYWLDDAERAAVLHAMLEPFAGLAVMVGRAASCQGPVDLYLARVAMTMGRPSEAVAHYEAAAALARRMGDLPFLYESRYGLGRALATRSRPGDRERALAELTASLDGAEEIGMRRLLERSLVARLEVQGLADIDVLTSIEAVVEAVGSERPDLSALASGDGTVTILFSDIENSTLINERLGDERWLEVLREHNRIFRSRLGEHGGYEVKSQGDGFMLAFAEPVDALAFAIAVQRELAESAAAGAEGTSVRMGMHTGVAIAEGGDLFGRSVVLAARIAAQALGGEILVSEALAESCARAGEGTYAFDAGRELELKGLSGTHRVFRVELEQAEAALSVAATG